MDKIREVYERAVLSECLASDSCDRAEKNFADARRVLEEARRRYSEAQTERHRAEEILWATIAATHNVSMPKPRSF